MLIGEEEPPLIAHFQVFLSLHLSFFYQLLRNFVTLKFYQIHNPKALQVAVWRSIAAERIFKYVSNEASIQQSHSLKAKGYPGNTRESYD